MKLIILDRDGVIKPFLLLIFCIGTSLLLAILNAYHIDGRFEWEDQNILIFLSFLSYFVSLLLSVSLFKKYYIIAAKEKKISIVVKYALCIVLVTHLCAPLMLSITFISDHEALAILAVFCVLSFLFMLIFTIVLYARSTCIT